MSKRHRGTSCSRTSWPDALIALVTLYRAGNGLTAAVSDGVGD